MTKAYACVTHGMPCVNMHGTCEGYKYGVVRTRRGQQKGKGREKEKEKRRVKERKEREEKKKERGGEEMGRERRRKGKRCSDDQNSSD